MQLNVPAYTVVCQNCNIANCYAWSMDGCLSRCFDQRLTMSVGFKSRMRGLVRFMCCINIRIIYWVWQAAWGLDQTVTPNTH